MTKFAPIDLDPFPGNEATSRVSRRPDIGIFRSIADGAITDARTDSEIAREFIAHGELGAKSIANTQKELYRFLTWCREEVGKSFHADLGHPRPYVRQVRPEPAQRGGPRSGHPGPVRVCPCVVRMVADPAAGGRNLRRGHRRRRRYGN